MTRKHRFDGPILVIGLIFSCGTFVSLNAQTTTSKAPAQYPAQFNRQAVPSSVSVRNPQPLMAVPLVEMAVGKLPDYLKAATVVTRDVPKYSADTSAGRLDIDVVEDGPLFLGVSWLYDGSIKGEMWYDYTFRDEGWVPFGLCDVFNSATKRGERTTLYFRECKAGEKFRVRTRVNHPPILIVPASGAPLPKLVDFEPDPALPEATQYETIRAKATALLDAGRFDELERWAEGYIRNDARFPSGHSKFAEVCYPFSFPLSNETEEKFLRRMKLTEEWIRIHPTSTAARLVLGSSCVRFSVFLRFSREVQDGEARAAEMHRRALEALYEVEQSGIKTPDLYAQFMKLAGEEEWDEELMLSYADKALDTGRWCPEVVRNVVSNLYYRYTTDFDQSEKRNKAITTFLNAACDRMRSKYGDALYAAAFMESFRVTPSAPFHSGYADWSRMKAAFDDLHRHFPNSRRNVLLNCRFACAAGDRETARKLFEQLGEIDNSEENVWVEGHRLRAEQVWTAEDFPSGRQRALIEHPGSDVIGARWLGDDGRIILADGSGNVFLCDGKTKPTFHIKATVQAARSVDLSEDGSRFLVGSKFDNLTIVDIPNRKRSKLGVNLGNITAVRLTDGADRAVVGGERGGVAVFDLTDVSQIRSETAIADAHAKQVIYVGFLPDQNLAVSVGQDGSVSVMDVDTGEIRKRWPTHPRGVGAAVLTCSGDRLITIGTDNRICAWDLDGRKLHEVATRGLRALSAAVSPDDRLLAVGGGVIYGIRPESIYLYNVESLKNVALLSGHKAAVTSLDFSADGASLLSGSYDSSLRVWTMPKR